MIKLKTILSEGLITELSENSTLYHRSLKKMKVGDIIKPKTDKSGKHWLAGIPFELVLEEFRKNNFPDKPSRLSCVYSSAVPRSRFSEKGYLYVIKPIGKMFMTDSTLIDTMADRFSRDVSDEWINHGLKMNDVKNSPSTYMRYLDGVDADRYWKGRMYNDVRSKINDIEILSESARIIEVVSEDKLVIGDKVRVLEDGKIYCWLDLYLFHGNMIDKYNRKNDEIFNKFIASVKNMFGTDVKVELSTYKDSETERSGRLTLKGYLKKGTKLKILFIESSGFRKYEDGDYGRPGKYRQMLFGFYLGNKYYERERKNEDDFPGYRMQYADFMEHDKKGRAMDISKYLKKI